MNNTDILIIGAGAAGLMAAFQLARAGKKVIVLEARDRCGGRIHTINNVEMGAEFIHGDLPLTLNLLKEAGIGYHPSGGETWQYRDDKFNRESFMTDWDLLAGKLQIQEKDLSINQFLANEFADSKFDRLKKSVRAFAAGYDTADPDKASTFALRDEWLNEDESAQHRVKGGYSAMITYMAREVEAAGGSIFLNSVVKEISWQRGHVTATTANGTIYEAEKAIIALPLGVLSAGENEKAVVTFNPPVSSQKEAFGYMGFGAIIKVLLEFDKPFWEDEAATALAGGSLKKMGFLLSGEEIPTWWTQAPQHSAILTGWLGGPAAAVKKEVTDGEILGQSLQSLSNIFKRSVEELKGKLLKSYVMNWTADPFTLGSYAYDTVESSAAREVLNEPVEDVLFFAGEYLYGGRVMGTVEAALESGSTVTKKLLAE